MKEVFSRISESTSVSIGVVALVVGITICIVNLASVAADADKKADSALNVLQKIDRRLSRIEGKLGIDGKPTDEGN